MSLYFMYEFLDFNSKMAEPLCIVSRHDDKGSFAAVSIARKKEKNIFVNDNPENFKYLQLPSHETVVWAIYEVK